MNLQKKAHGVTIPICAAIILFVGFCANGIILLTDYQIWDSTWIGHEFGLRNDAEGFRRFLAEVGKPYEYYLFALVGSASVFWVRLLSLVLWLGASISLFGFLLLGVRLRVAFALAVVCVYVSVPFYDLIGELSVLTYTFAMLLFWTGFALAGISLRQKSPRALLFRITALMALFLAFNLNSLLVYCYGVFALWICGADFIERKPLELWAIGAKVLRLADFVMLPVLFWILKTTFTPSFGFYANYNKPSVSLERVIVGTQSLLQSLGAELLRPVGWPFVILGGVLVALLVALLMSRSPRLQEWTCPASVGLSAVLAGLLLLPFATAPYMFVGQQFSDHGWLSRNCILLGLPLALVLCGAAVLCSRFFGSNNKGAWCAIVAFIVTLSAASSIYSYTRLQAQGAKQQSIAASLIALSSTETASVIQLRDYCIIPDTITYYPPIVWTYLATSAGKHPETFVFEIAGAVPAQQRLGPDGQLETVLPAVEINSGILERLINDTTMPYMLHSIPRAGPQFMAVVTPGSMGTDGFAIGLKYLYLKYLRPRELPEFLKGLTNVEVLRIPPVAST